jgi:hypothetical protein
MEVVRKEKCQGDIPRTTQCLDFLRDISQKRIPPTEKKSRPTKRCVVCYKNNKMKETGFWCSDCEASLCVEGCFKTYHTKLNN